MDFLKNLWPTPFKIKRGNLVSFIVQLIIFLVICAVAGALISILAKIWLIGIIFIAVGSLVELYGFIGIVLCILKYFAVI